MEPIVWTQLIRTQGALGFSAKDLHAIDPHLVNLDAQGRPDSVRFDVLCAHLLAALQDHERRLREGEARP